jgi:chromosomal replication initiation ATPase DnaA
MVRKGRHRNLHRNLAIYLCRELCPIEAKELGALFGCLAASTISHCARIIGEKRRTDQEFHQTVTQLERMLGCEETPLFETPSLLAYLYS